MFASHDFAPVSRLCGRVLLVDGGKAAVGTPEEVGVVYVRRPA